MGVGHKLYCTEENVLPTHCIGEMGLLTKGIQKQKMTWETSPSGPWFNIKMTSYQYRKSHCGDKTILRPSYLHNGISYAGKITYLYWIRAQGMHEAKLDQEKC